MCGLTGIFDVARNTGSSQLTEQVQRMTDAIRYRGPDDGGIWVEERAGIALGSRRLAIIDVSSAGHQPMHSASGRYVVAFNGEIYNFQDLRAKLMTELNGEGPTWRGHSDTEVLLVGIERWGLERTLQQAVGMFAFALWDRVEQRLYLGRDRLGEKPLYYGWNGGSFLFGSELKALQAHPSFRGEIDRDALSLYLRLSYVPDPYSIYQDIRKLPPGTFLCLTAESAIGAMPVPIPYWSLRCVAEEAQSTPFAGSVTDARDELERVLRAAVRHQLVADVPLGAFLSGGIDSSTIVAMMQDQSLRPIKTFTIGVHEADYNEATHAKAVAHHLGTDHTELYVTPTEAMALIPQLPAIYDEPFADSSQIPTFLVASLARQHVTVSLSGDGGDELFGGYNRYVWTHDIWRRVERYPQPLRGAFANGVTALSPRAWDRLLTTLQPILPARMSQRVAGDKMHKLAAALTAPDLQGVYYTLNSPGYALFSSGDHDTTALDALVPRTQLGDFVQEMMYVDAMTYLPGDILVKVDRASMAVSLESRAPFLDHRVVELAWRLPQTMKVNDRQGKWLLRQVLDNYVPRALVERPKSGFGIPLGEWLRGPLREWAEPLLNRQRLQQEGWLDPEVVAKLWQEHVAERRNWQAPLWNVLMFQCWKETQCRP